MRSQCFLLCVSDAKEVWEGDYYYIPPNISGDLDEELARLRYEYRDLTIKKKPDFNVVMVVDGWGSIQKVSGEECKERLNEVELI